MKKLNSNIKKNIDKVHYYSFLLMIFMLPIYRQLIPLLIGINTVLCFVKFLYFPKTKWTRPWFVFLFVLPYLFIIPGIFFSENTFESNFDLGVKIPLLIFPILFSFSLLDLTNTKRFRETIYFFIFGCFIASLICLVHSVYMFVQTDYWYYVFYYVNLSILYHPSYFAMFLNFAIALLLFVIICKRKSVSLRERKWAILLIIYFLTFIIFLNSKAGIISTGITLLLYVLYIIFSRKRAVLGITILAGIISIISMLIILIPSSTSRFTEAFTAIKNLKHTDKSTIDGTSERLFIWKYAYELTLENPLIGLGNGDAKDKLIAVYKQQGLQNAYKQRLNAHNQFLQNGLASGFPGIAVLLAALILPLFVSRSKNSLLYFSFILLIFINFQVESMLETQAGVVFYAIFNAALFFNIYSTNTINTKPPTR